MLENPSVESVAGDHTQLFTDGLLVIFHEGPFLLGIVDFLTYFLCADVELGAECLPSDSLWWPGSGLKGRSVSLGFHLMV